MKMLEFKFLARLRVRLPLINGVLLIEKVSKVLALLN